MLLSSLLQSRLFIQRTLSKVMHVLLTNLNIQCKFVQLKLYCILEGDNPATSMHRKPLSAKPPLTPAGRFATYTVSLPGSDVTNMSLMACVLQRNVGVGFSKGLVVEKTGNRTPENRYRMSMREKYEENKLLRKKRMLNNCPE